MSVNSHSSACQVNQLYPTRRDTSEDSAEVDDKQDDAEESLPREAEEED